MKVINQASGKEVADDVRIAQSFFQRLKGLIPEERLENGQGLLIRPCSSIHTFMMKFPIDVVYLDETGRVMGLEENLPPNRVGKKFENVSQVLELPAGTIQKNKIKIWDRLEVLQHEEAVLNI
ncbi:MAG: DUF192 domain-containing protein [Bacillaceae bacterium]|nr:DUF192 domain-containing protein [Bacillaceae bacterium]